MRNSSSLDWLRFMHTPNDYRVSHLSPDLNGNGEIEPEEWIKACPCFDAETGWNQV